MLDLSNSEIQSIAEIVNDMRPKERPCSKDSQLTKLTLRQFGVGSLSTFQDLLPHTILAHGVKCSFQPHQGCTETQFHRTSCRLDPNLPRHPRIALSRRLVSG